MASETAESVSPAPEPRPGALRRFADWFVRAPDYPATAADRRTVNLVGVEMPFRVIVVVTVVTFALLFDYSRTFIPESVRQLGFSAEGMRAQSIERFVLFGVVPVLVVLFVFRDGPGRYGLRLGDWRAGVPLAITGIVAMTPIVAFLAATPAFQAYYAPSVAPVPDLVVTHSLDLFPAEFLLRGFLMFPLIRLFGGAGLLLATMPFVFSHLGKPEIETFSTLFGGLVYAWVDWRTGSIVWSAIAHVYIVTLVVTLAAS